MSEWDNIHSFERFANAAFDLRNNYIQALISEAKKRGISEDAVKIFMETDREEAAELLEYAKQTDFKFGD